MAKVAYVLRVSTVGGAAPGVPPTKPDQTVRVRYRATYIFLAAAPTAGGA